MKKLLSFFAMALCVLTSLSSCSNDTEYEGQEEQDNVKVTFIYTLDTSNGSAMSRATTNAEVFNEFYAKIKSGELVASSYNLTLTETTTSAVYTFKGEWNSHELVTLRTGVYNIVGESKAEGENIQEKCSFTFEEQIEINAESNTIILHANYDCYLLIFSNSNIESLENNNGSSQASFYTFGNYKYAFVNNKLFIEEYKNNAYIKGIYTDEAEFKIFTGNLNFEKGKYYVYNSISNGFDVPPMEEGGNTTNNEFGNVAEAIDLGLSVKWASWNVGASSPEECGLYFCWAGLEPRTISARETHDAPYEIGADIWSKYTTETEIDKIHNGIPDDKVMLDLEDDVAHVRWGKGWRIPSPTEIQELIDYCEWTWTEQEGKSGYVVTGRNGNSIFIPESGHTMWEESIVHNGITTLLTNGLYISLGHSWINALYFTSTQKYTRNIGRIDISAIRPVYSE